ncbi:hypothetical protein [Escherichia coli]|jgi:hypothetical protein|nr:hypothetical protein [Escherichia coli]EEZ6988464.1 hypothetical protein [Escherichia coli O109]EEZ9830337.1 hypothetical protein [Escherichia coli O153]AWJ04228.1 hypothetical protein DEP49_07550 [Escherichia coli]EER7164074.1 hypothetical protein [Escherichia coli]EEV5925297.1 hypothetical protein [Escherichia coli]
MIKQKLKNDWDIPAILRLTKEQKRLKLSVQEVADLLDLSSYFFELAVDEKVDFKFYDLPEKVKKKLHYAGFDIFYLMTGEYSGSEPALKIASFEYSIKDMSPEEKNEVRVLIENIPITKPH